MELNSDLIFACFKTLLSWNFKDIPVTSEHIFYFFWFYDFATCPLNNFNKILYMYLPMRTSSCLVDTDQNIFLFTGAFRFRPTFTDL